MKVLGLNEISHVRAFTDLASRAQVRIRTDHRRFVDTGAINHASGPDQNAVADLRIADYAIGTNPAVTSDLRRAHNLNERFNGRVRTDFDIAIDYAGLRVKNSDACSHKPLALCSADALINIHQFATRVATQNFISIVGWESNYTYFGFI